MLFISQDNNEKKKKEREIWIIGIILTDSKSLFSNLEVQILGPSFLVTYFIKNKTENLQLAQKRKFNKYV